MWSIEGFADNLIDLGLGKLKEFMEPDEIFLTNHLNDQNLYKYIEPKWGITSEDVRNAQQVADMYMSTGDYESVRVIPQAFARDGKPAPTYVAIVAQPKVQTPKP